MNTMRLILAACLMASLAAATVCPAFQNTVYASDNCTGYTACETTFCTCAGGTAHAPYGPDGDFCLHKKKREIGAAHTTTCALLKTCSVSFLGCLNGVAAAASGNTDDACNTWAFDYHHDQLNYALGTVYAESGTESGCESLICRIYNASGHGYSEDGCGNGSSLEADLCLDPFHNETTAPNTTAAAETDAPTTAAPNTTAAASNATVETTSAATNATVETTAAATTAATTAAATTAAPTTAALTTQVPVDTTPTSTDLVSSASSVSTFVLGAVAVFVALL